jgi:anti-anti-sigma factor
MHINAKRNGDQLTLELVGRLDVTTASGLAPALQLEGVRQLVLDLAQCTYISSAGLREFLLAHKRMVALGGAMHMANVSRSIQEVLDLTGLSKVVLCKPKVRQISIEGLEFLSAGVCGECFRLDDDTIVKLYREGIAPEIAEKEKEFARAAFVSGIPTAISYDIVACGNRTGVVYEMLDAQLFSVVIKNDLEHIDRHARADRQELSRHPGRPARLSRHQGRLQGSHRADGFLPVSRGDRVLAAPAGSAA